MEVRWWDECFDLTVRVEGADDITLLGETRLEGDTLLFEPRFPWEPGLTYEATYHDPARPVTHRFTIPTLTFEETAVLAVHPSADELPSNLLKLYVQFSAPMSRGAAYRSLHLVDAEHGEVELPFLELAEELWDTTGTRFTLFFDPGRIKREVKPLEEVGPALEPGREYTLVVDEGWLDSHGQPLRSGFEKRFRVTEPDREQPVPADWTIRSSVAGTRKPLEVVFDEPLDRALLERMLRVTDPDGSEVTGVVAVGADETSWRVTPARDWAGGEYVLVVDTRLEDRAGNSVGRAFEVEMTEGVGGAGDGVVELPFVVGVR